MKLFLLHSFLLSSRIRQVTCPKNRWSPTLCLLVRKYYPLLYSIAGLWASSSRILGFTTQLMPQIMLQTDCIQRLSETCSRSSFARFWTTTYLLDMSGYRCGQTGAKASASLVPDQLGGGGGAPSRGGRPAYGTPQNTSTGSSRRDAGSTMMPRIAPKRKKIFFYSFLSMSAFSNQPPAVHR